MSCFRFTPARLTVTVAATGLFLLAGAGVASAHVTAHSPDSPARGGDAEIVFRVPDESDTAHTVKIEVDFSTTSPLSNADIKPVPGWTAQETMMTLPRPVRMDNEDVTTAVRSVTWTARPGQGIGPGQFLEFAISVEGLPDNTNELDMPTTQTYDDNQVVHWNQPTAPGRPEPEHPTPRLALAAATSADPAPATGDGVARWLGGIGVVVAALALGFGVGAFVRGRRVPA